MLVKWVVVSKTAPRFFTLAADKTITCRDCATQFVFSVREQEFFAEKGFGDPVRCVACRRALKAKRQGEGDGAGAPGGGPQAQRPPAPNGEGRPRWGEDRPRREGGGRPFGGPGGGRDFDRGPRDRRQPEPQAGSESSEFDEFPELRPNYRADPVLAGQDVADRRERPRGFSEDYPNRKQREKRSTRPRYEETGGEE